MDRHSDVIQNENGRAVAGASVLILNESGQAATIYADRSGTPTSNPLTTDTLGKWSFCAPDGLYTAQISLGSVLKATLQDIRLEDPADDFAALASEVGAGMVGAASGNTVQEEIDALKQADEGLVYTLPVASASTLGGIKVGSNLSIDGSGVLHASFDSGGVVQSVNGVSPTGGNVSLTTADIPENTNLYHTEARVRDTVLDGLSTATNAVIAAADTVLSALGKLQKQISDWIAAKDASGGYPGLTLFKINFRDAANTFTSFFTNANTAARTYTFPDKDGMVAMTSDIPTGGSMVLLGSATVSTPVAIIDFLTAFSSGAYDKVIIDLQKVYPSADDTLTLRVAEAGVVITTASYSALVASGSSMGALSNSMALSPTASRAVNQVGANFTIEIRNINTTGANAMKAIGQRGFNHNVGSTYEALIREGRYETTAALSGFRLYWASGSNFAGGTVRVYGIKNS